MRRVRCNCPSKCSLKTPSRAASRNWKTKPRVGNRTVDLTVRDTFLGRGCLMSAKTRQLRFRVVSLICGVLALGLLHFNLRADTRPVVLAGQPAPGTANGRFTAFGPASVNAAGDMVFEANLNVGGVDSAGIFKTVGGVLSPVVLEGQLLPD